jgi:hypothetical protein
MKNLVSLPLALIVAATAVSCGGGPKGDALAEPYRISFDISTIDRSAPFPTMSEMIDSIEYIKLEYIADHPVGDIDGLAIGEDYLMVYDSDAGMFQYTRDGRFVRMIGSRGRGPGEYLRAGYMYIDEKEKALYAVCRSAVYNVLKFDLTTGKLLGESAITENDGSPLRPGTMLGDFIPLSDGVFLSSGGGSFGSTDDDSNIDAFLALDIRSARITHREASGVYTPGPSMLLPQPLWLDTVGRATVFETGADTMYVVGKDYSRTPRIIADFGGRNIDIHSSDSETGMVLSDAKESGRYILFRVLEGTPPFRWENYLMSFDKATGERRLAPKLDNFFFEGPANDIDGGGGFAHMYGYNEDVWYASYDAFRMIENLTPEHFEKVRETVKYPDRLEKLQALVSTLKEEDNPVIAIARVKR